MLIAHSLLLGEYTRCRTLGHRNSVEQKNFAFFSSDVAACLQILDDSADHLTRSADHARDFLFGRCAAHYPDAVDLLGLVEQKASDTAIDIEQRQAFNLAIG